MKRIAYGDFAGETRNALNKHLATPKAHRRRVRRPFDTLRANDEKPNNKSQTLFFGIPKGTFYKKSPCAGHGAEPHEYSLTALSGRRSEQAWDNDCQTKAGGKGRRVCTKRVNGRLPSGRGLYAVFIHQRTVQPRFNGEYRNLKKRVKYNKP